jgi:hypothetical protein
MNPWETLTMSRKEVAWAGLLKAAVARQISNAQAAVALHLNLRQVQRPKGRYRAEGAAGLHGSMIARASRGLRERGHVAYEP